MRGWRLRFLVCWLLSLPVFAGCSPYLRGSHKLADFNWPAGMVIDDDLQPLAELLESQAWTVSPEWTPLVEMPGYPRAAGESVFRWSHPQGVKRAAGLSALKDEDLTRLADAPSRVGFCAAVLLAQRHPESRQRERTLERIATLPADARSITHFKWPKLPIGLRAAAAEAWCHVLATSAQEPEKAMAPAGRAFLQRDLPPEVRAELMRGIARRVAPHRIPGLMDKLSRPSTIRRDIERQAAVDALVIHAVHNEKQRAAAVVMVDAESVEQHWDWLIPLDYREKHLFRFDLETLKQEPTPDIRKRFAELVAVTRHPNALPILKAFLIDQDSHVRHATLVACGALGTPEAFVLLRPQLERDEDLTKVFAARGMAFGGPDLLAPLSLRTEPRVRAEVAARLAGSPNSTAVRILFPLIADGNAPVYTAALETVAVWPDALALPLLLQCLTECPSPAPRVAALRQLQERHEDVRFPVDGTPHARAAAAAQLASAWGLPETDWAGVRALADPQNPQVSVMRLQEIQLRLETWKISRNTPDEAEVIAWLEKLALTDVPPLEQLLETTDIAASNLLLTRILPRIHPEYQALENLSPAHDLVTRQSAARSLHGIGQSQSLRLPVLVRLRPILAREPDPGVWRDIMRAVALDGRDEASQLALLAVQSPWADIRILGCDYVSSHAQHLQAAWVMPLFKDDNPVVQLAAVRAAARCHNPLVLDAWSPPGTNGPLKGLRQLQFEAQGDLKLAVVAAMCRLGDEAAQRELVRMAQDPTPNSRTAAILAMGDSGQTRFVDPLVRLAWTESVPTVRKAALDTLQQLVPAEQQPRDLPRARNAAEAVEMWTTHRHESVW